MKLFNREFYERYAQRDTLWTLSENSPVLFHEKLRTHRLIRFCPNRPESVLDCGCGDGFLSALTVPIVEKLVALDISFVRLQKYSGHPLLGKIPRVEADSCLIPFKEESFDTVLVSELLEHVEEDDLMLKQIWHSLKKGGRFVLSVPYKEMINTVICPSCHHEFFRHGHLHSYDKSKLFEQLKSAGFANIRFRFSNNDKTKKMRGKRFLPFNWIVNLDTFFSFLFPNQSRFLIAIAEKSQREIPLNETI